MFDDGVIKEVVKVARVHEIEPAALMAVVEVESAGKAFEKDGKTPCLLFERHVFYRCLAKDAPEKLQRAVETGLAHKDWRPKSKAGPNNQYRDQQTSAGRLELLAKARAVDEERANQACSWGIGQVLGENAKGIGYTSANNMVNEIVGDGIPGQVECFVREIETSKLVEKLNAHDWAGFARRYNGPSYKANRYDDNMAAAYAKWGPKLDAMVVETVKPGAIEPSISMPESRENVEPKPITKSTTLWASFMASASAVWSAVATFSEAHKLYVFAGLVIVVLAISWIAKERIKRFIEDNT